MKIKRRDKIDTLAELYKNHIIGSTHNVAIINQVIIDSVGITGLKAVKKKAWE